jgi:GTPase SAR1 family protein
MSDSSRVMDFLSLYPRPTLDILVLGAPGSGKRSFCGRLAHDLFPFERDPTEDGQFHRMVQLFPPEAERSFHVLCNWTTILADPKEMNPGILQQMVREHEVFVLLYRTSDRATFQAIEGLWRDLIAGRGDSMSFVVANGGDDDVVSGREGQALADKLGATFWPMSAKTGQGAAEQQVAAMAKTILLRRMR